MRVTVDDRESRSGVVERLRAVRGMEVSIERLAVGDYLVADQIIVERKTLRDLAFSLMDGRLFRQAARLVSSGYRPVLLMENDGVLAGQPLPVKRDAIQGALITLSLIFGIPALRSLDTSETARLIAGVAGQLERSASSICRPGYRPRSRRRRQLYILQGFPGIGPRRAGSLLDRFVNLRSIFNAERKALEDIEGIGAKTSARMLDLLL